MVKQTAATTQVGVCSSDASSMPPPRRSAAGGGGAAARRPWLRGLGEVACG
jgi:hypothetical protein